MRIFSRTIKFILLETTKHCALCLYIEELAIVFSDDGHLDDCFGQGQIGQTGAVIFAEAGWPPDRYGLDRTSVVLCLQRGCHWERLHWSERGPVEVSGQVYHWVLRGGCNSWPFCNYDREFFRIFINIFERHQLCILFTLKNISLSVSLKNTQQLSRNISSVHCRIY